MPRLLLLTACATLALAVPLPAQTPAAVAKAVETITAQAVARHIGVIADDSMLGRDTPSAGLDMTAQYVADQFQRLGLTAASDKDWIERYEVPGHRRFDYDKSYIRIHLAPTKGVRDGLRNQRAPARNEVRLDFATGALLAVDSAPVTRSDASMVVVAGRHTAASLQQVAVRGQSVIYIPPGDTEPAARERTIASLSASSLIVIMPSDEDSASFAQRLYTARQRPALVIPSYLVSDNAATVYVQPDVLREVLASAGMNLDELRAARAPVVQELSSVRVRVDLSPEKRDDLPTAPNVVGRLRGSDPKLEREYLIFTAHMDHVGIRRDAADRIRNGANDNASGVAGLLALAQAFSQPGTRPRRSILFVATSGGAEDLWGSRAFARQYHGRRGGRQGRRVAITINLDRIGRHVGDSIARPAITVRGLQDLELPAPPDWIAAAHPELRLTVVDGGTVVSPVSDHFAFARLALPSLSFQNGAHGDEQAADSPATIDADYVARVTRLVFYVGQEIANADTRPRWTSAGRQRVTTSDRP